MDYLLFTLITLGGFVALHFGLRRLGGEMRSPLPLWIGIACLLTAGWFYTRAAGEHACEQLRKMVEGFAPTYAQEIERMGHSDITQNTDPTDPAYLAIIAAQLRWAQVNPSVADIYTMRKLRNGSNVFIVDAETDYDRNDQFEGEAEERTKIGEIYSETDEGLERAFEGEANFADTPITDRWGTWVSAFVPLHDAKGRVEAVLGVDYPAANWIHAKSQARISAMKGIFVLILFLAASSTMIDLLRTDIRNRKQAEERLIQANSELEQRVKIRTAELESTLRKSVEASRMAWVADGAREMSRNVGKLLTSLDASSSRVVDGVKRSRSASLIEVAAFLRDHPGGLSTDPKGTQVPGLVVQVAEQLSADQAAILEELVGLQKSLGHLKEIVRQQP